MTDLFDSDKTKDSSSAYADSLDMFPSSSDFENYFSCFDELFYLSPDFSYEGEKQIHSVGTITSEVHKHILANTPLSPFLTLLGNSIIF